jgi:hypothetical protein
MPIHSTGEFSNDQFTLTSKSANAGRSSEITPFMLLPLLIGYLSAAALNQPLARMVAGAEGDLSMLTVVQLKDKLRTAGLPVSGRKAELIERLSATACPADAASVSEGRAFPLIGIEACTQ